MENDNWQQVKDIFAEALRKEPSERRQYLDRVCADDKPLRAEIESLLLSINSAESFMETPAADDFYDNGQNESRIFVKGQIVGHYEIIRQIGKGGMGSVFLADDLKLRRRVALKILRENSSWKTQAKQRLLREAQASARLYHPNICAIYEISEASDCSFIAMQFAEGETLSDILAKQHLSPERSIQIVIQIADALQASHSHDIVHRDIKPSNIVIDNNWHVKVLDFGLAKFIEDKSDRETNSELSSSGLIMGTVPYMSPEQLRGEALDTRTDIFSFGVVLHEMLSGESPFQRDSNAEAISAILYEEPDWVKIPADLRPVVRTALMKERDKRYQSARDLLFSLRNIELDSSDSESERYAKTTKGLIVSTDEQRMPVTEGDEEPQKTILSKNNYRRILAIPVIAILLSSFAGLAWWRLSSADTNLPASLSVSQFVNWKRDLGEDIESSARFSPDGKLVAFSSTRGGVSAIWLKQVGGGEPFSRKQDQWPESSPVFSPDGQQIAFLSKRGDQNGIWSMPMLGGNPTLLKSLDGSGRQLLKWSKDGTTIYFQMDKNFFALNLPTKEITKLTDLDSWQTGRINFNISPDEESIAYIGKQDGQTDIWVVSKHGGERIRITNDEFEERYLVWLTNGQSIIYDSVRNDISQIFAVRLDGSPPAQLIFSDNSNYVSDVSPDGKNVLYYSQRDDADLWKVSIDNLKETRLTENIGMEFWTDVATDNSAVVFQAERPADVIDRIIHSSLITQGGSGENQSLQLSDDGFLPRWSPDGKRVTFMRVAENLTNLWIVASIGGEAKPLTGEGISFGGYVGLPMNRSSVQEYQWSPDSRRLVYCANRDNVSNVWQTMADGSGETRLTDNNDPAFRFFGPVLSPDGQRIAWFGFALPTGSQKKIKWSIWIYDEGKTKMLYQSESVLRLVGWTQSGRELIIKSVTGENRDPKFPTSVDLLQVSDKGEVSRLFQLSGTYLFSICLAPDRQKIGYVTRKGGADSIHVISAKGGSDRAILDSNDIRVYFAGLTWSPDGKTIYFGKQANWQVISMIENLK